MVPTGRLEHDVNGAALRRPIYRGRWRKRWFIPIGEPLEDLPPLKMTILVVRQVRSVAVEDGADVSSYTTNGLAYEPTKGKLRIGPDLRVREIVVQCDDQT